MCIPVFHLCLVPILLSFSPGDAPSLSLSPHPSLPISSPPLLCVAWRVSNDGEIRFAPRENGVIICGKRERERREWGGQAWNVNHHGAPWGRAGPPLLRMGSGKSSFVSALPRKDESFALDQRAVVSRCPRRLPPRRFNPSPRGGITFRSFRWEGGGRVALATPPDKTP